MSIEEILSVSQLAAARGTMKLCRKRQANMPMKVTPKDRRSQIAEVSSQTREP